MASKSFGCDDRISLQVFTASAKWPARWYAMADSSWLPTRVRVISLLVMQSGDRKGSFRFLDYTHRGYPVRGARKRLPSSVPPLAAARDVNVAAQADARDQDAAVGR